MDEDIIRDYIEKNIKIQINEYYSMNCKHGLSVSLVLNSKEVSEDHIMIEGYNE